MQNISVGKQKFLLIPPFEEVYKTSFQVASGGNGRASVVWTVPQDTETCKSSLNAAVSFKLGPHLARVLTTEKNMQLPQQKNA